MVKKISKPVQGLLFFAVLIVLFVSINEGFNETYDLQDEYKQVMTINGITENRTIGSSFDDLNIITSLNSTATAVQSIKAPDNPADLLGALAAAAIGTVTLIGGIVTLPFEIVGILTGFYMIPPIVPFALVISFVISIGFIILSKFLGGDKL